MPTLTEVEKRVSRGGLSLEKLSVIMPVYNEEETIAEAVERSLAVDVSPLQMEILVVNDGSDDRTGEILERFMGRHDVKIFSHPDNRGKGAAIRTALEHVGGTLVIIEDADLELDPREYPNLLEPILNDRADVVFGSRFKGNVRNMQWTHWLANRLLSLLASILYLKRVTDEATCYKVFRAETLRSFDLECVGFEFCPEVTAKALRNGYRYVEVPIHYYGREIHGGKKIQLKDAFIAVFTLVKYRFKK